MTAEKSEPLKINIGPSDWGWCDYSVSLHGQVWKTRASYLANHPIENLLRSIFQIYHHLYIDSETYEDNTDWDCQAYSEGGGICIRLSPEEEGEIYVAVYDFITPHDIPCPNTYSKVAPVAQGFMNFWDLAKAIHEAAQQCLSQQTLPEFRKGWLMESYAWNTDSQSLFPFEHFLYLSQLLGKNPKLTLSQTGERKIIQEL